MKAASSQPPVCKVAQKCNPASPKLPRGRRPLWCWRGENGKVEERRKGSYLGSGWVGELSVLQNLPAFLHQDSLSPTASYARLEYTAVLPARLRKNLTVCRPLSGRVPAGLRKFPRGRLAEVAERLDCRKQSVSSTFRVAAWSSPLFRGS